MKKAKLSSTYCSLAVVPPLLTILIICSGWLTAQAGEQDTAKKPPSVLIGTPYLQLGNVPLGDSSARVDILWHASPDSSAWSVQYKEVSQSSWKKAEDPIFRLVAIQGVAPHRIYAVTIRGLISGQPFDYRVVRNNQPLFVGRATAKNSASQDYRFAVFGDCGANTPSQRKVAYQAYLDKPNFILIPGDIVYGGGRISEYRTNFFSIYEAAQASPETGAPLLNSTIMIASPGNHDTVEERGEGAPDELAYFLYWSQPLNGPLLKAGGPNSPLPEELKVEAGFETAAGSAFPTMENFSFDWGNAHWTVLDSNDYADWSNPTMRKWIEDDLRQAQSKTWRFVAFHHPGFSSSTTHFENQWMRTLSDLFEAGRVDIVFNGHVHNYQRSYPLTFEIADNYKPGKVPWDALTGGTVDGTISVDNEFDGITRTHPKGIIYIVTGAGGEVLYNPEQQDKPETWQKFTAKFISTIHSFTLVDIHDRDLHLKQISEDGQLLDQIRITK